MLTYHVLQTQHKTLSPKLQKLSQLVLDWAEPEHLTIKETVRSTGVYLSLKFNFKGFGLSDVKQRFIKWGQGIHRDR